MNLLIIDTETTGFDPEKDTIIEIAAALFSVEHKQIVTQVSALIQRSAGSALIQRSAGNLTDPISRLTGITSGLLGGYTAEESTLRLIDDLIDASSFFVAFNSDFDESFLSEFDEGFKDSLNWLDAQDIRYPNSDIANGKSLTALAIAHGIPVVNAHRALADVQLLAQLLAKVEDLPGEIKRAARPKVLVISQESYPGTESKKAGFIWNGIVEGRWAKRMPDEDRAGLLFETFVMEGL